MTMTTAHARYVQGALSFDAAVPPIPDGVDVTIIFPAEMPSGRQHAPGNDPVAQLRGRAKGEKLTEMLLSERARDRARE